MALSQSMQPGCAHLAPLTVLVAISSAVIVSGAKAASASAPSEAALDTTYGSLQQLPDWSGWWYLDLAPSETPTSRYLAKAPLRPEALEKFQAAAASGAADRAGTSETEKTLQCRPPGFNGVNNGGFTEDIEFLFTPGRVTLANESGLVRRIFTDGSASMDEIAETNTGISAGRWEGQTLVVETHGLDPNTVYGPRWPGAPRIGHNVRTRERIALRDPNTLEIALRMEAPELFTAPFETTFVYKRHRGHHFHEYRSCEDADRSLDPVSGKERFDLTPPANLPPPPKD